MLENMRYRVCLRRRIIIISRLRIQWLLILYRWNRSRQHHRLSAIMESMGTVWIRFASLMENIKIRKRGKSSKGVLSGKMAASHWNLEPAGTQCYLSRMGKVMKLWRVKFWWKHCQKRWRNLNGHRAPIFPLVRICRILLLVSRKMNMAFSSGRTRKFVHRLKIQVSMLCFVRQTPFGMTGARWQGMMRRQRQLHARFRLPCVRWKENCRR